MKTWKITKEINASIDKVWEIIDGSEENLKKLDPKIVSQKTIIETENRLGSRYLQQYKEGKKVIEYEVVVTDYFETDVEKSFKIEFNIAKWFDISVAYKLDRLSEDKTLITYTTTNKPTKIIAKIMMKLMPGGQGILEKHVERIEELAQKL